MGIAFSIDGVRVQGEPGETILMAAERAGIYIPRLCAHETLEDHGSCRVCMVLVNGSDFPSPSDKGPLTRNPSDPLSSLRPREPREAQDETQNRHGFDGRMLRLPHVVARHRPATVRARRAGRL